jgi:hypothetical protein
MPAHRAVLGAQVWDAKFFGFPWVAPASVLAVPPSVQGLVTKIACGPQHIVAMLTNSSVVAWGDNPDGRATVPAAAQGGATVEVSAGGTFSLFRLNSGAVLKAGLLPNAPTATLVASGATALASGSKHALVIVSGKLQVFGDTTGQSGAPAAALNSPAKVSAGDTCNLVLTTTGSLAAWGVLQGQPSCGLVPFELTTFSGFSEVRSVGALVDDNFNPRVAHAARCLPCRGCGGAAHGESSHLEWARAGVSLGLCWHATE